MISRQAVLRRRDSQTDPETGPVDWGDDSLVLPANPAAGRFGDACWVFPSVRPSARPTTIEFDNAEMFPTQEWRRLAKELGMALLGRRPGREQLARSRQQPITVAQALRRVALIGRWAEATGHGLPSGWTAATVDAFTLAYHASRLPNRVPSWSSKSSAGTRQTLAAYLNLFAMLYEHRHQLSHPMLEPPWQNWPAVGACQIAGVQCDEEDRTAIIEPGTWWAAVRAALRILTEWAPDVVRAWAAYKNSTRRRTVPWGPAALAILEAWAARPDSLLPVDEHGRPSWTTVAAWCGIDDRRLQDRPKVARLGPPLLEAGRATRYWWPEPSREAQQSVPHWLGHMDTADLRVLAPVVRNAALVVLAALSAMRVSELEELRRGCVEFHDGSWALRSTVHKHQHQAQPAIWWITPLAVQAIEALEGLVAPMGVYAIDPATGRRVESDHLVCSLGRPRHGLAGAGDMAFLRFTAWVDDNAARFGFDPIAAPITPHQFRRTFAVIAAWQPDGHVAVELQLKDTAEVAAGYYANHDRRWFETYELAKAEALGARLRSYGADDDPPPLAGPAGPDFAQRVFGAHRVTSQAGLDPVAAVDAHNQAANALAGGHVCGDGWDCAGDPRHARCQAVQAAKGDHEPIMAPQLAATLCFDPGADADRACRNVILDPPVHLAFWDVEAERLQHAIEHSSGEQPLLQRRLELELEGARASIAEMEAVCGSHPDRLGRRFEAERIHLLEQLADDQHTPGTAAIYRPLIRAQEARISWLRNLKSTQATGLAP